MTEAKHPHESKRPRRYAGGALRQVLRCPLCRSDALRVIAYRQRTVRLGCGACACRFSLDPLDVVDALRERPKIVVANYVTRDMAALVLADLDAGHAPATDEQEARERIAEQLRTLAAVIAYGVLSRPDYPPDLRAAIGQIATGGGHRVLRDDPDVDESS